MDHHRQAEGSDRMGSKDLTATRTKVGGAGTEAHQVTTKREMAVVTRARYPYLLAHLIYRWVASSPVRTSKETHESMESTVLVLALDGRQSTE